MSEQSEKEKFAVLIDGDNAQASLLPQILAEVSKGLGEPMVGIGVTELPENARLAARGW